jgi:beta-lactamase regulating signal transducer with metallopeptidase domain
MSSWIDATGWTLIHFVWQGSVIGVAAAAALRLCRRRSSEARYAVACLGLAAMLGSAAATAVIIGTARAEHGAASLAMDRTVSDVSIAAPQAGLAQPATARTKHRRLTMAAALPVVVWAWIAGVAALTIRLWGGCWRIHRLRTAALAQPPSCWERTAAQLAQRLRVSIPFRAVETTLVNAPMVIGWLRPMILLPAAFVIGATPNQIEALLAHELAHIRRRDYAVNLLQTAVEALLFFHPAVWWVSSRIRQEREHCCDDAAVVVCGEPAAYAEALVSLASWRTTEAFSVGASGGSLRARVGRILDAPLSDEQASGASGLVALAAGMLLVSGALVWSSPARAAARPAVVPQSQAQDWRVRHTDHFEIHYPAALDLHADRVAIEAEHAYERVSTDLRHNLAFRVPVVLLATAAELNARARGSATSPSDTGPLDGPSRDRILFPVDRPADQWLGLLTHEVTHVFTFDIIPGTSQRWVTEGLADYQRGTWDPADLAAVRDAVRRNAIPSLTSDQDGETAAGSRLVDAIGHAAFDFIESRWGKQGMRQFLLALRQLTSTGGEAYAAAFQLRADAFDQAFARYLRERFASSGNHAARFDRGATLRIEGTITAIGTPAFTGVACIDLWVAANIRPQLWAVECGTPVPADLLQRLKPGEHVIVSGAPARDRTVQRIALRALVRPADGFAWRSLAG